MVCYHQNLGLMAFGPTTSSGQILTLNLWRRYYLEVEAISGYPISVDSHLFHITLPRRYKYEMTQTETKIHHHELSWHSQRQDSFDAIRLTWIAIGTKRREVEKKNTKTKKNIKNIL